MTAGKKNKTRNFASDSKPKPAVWISLFLATIVWVVFGQTTCFGFINYDDDIHVYANAHVVGGLNSQNILWAFEHHHDDYWHPLDFLSHMLDCQIYGLQP